MISSIESFVQAENESRSANIRWGIRKGAADGTSGFYRQHCYGYHNNENGDLEIIPNEAEAVRLIFELYLNGASLNKIQDELHQRSIPSPNGRDTWCRQSINILLSNEKYSGDVLLMKSVCMGSLGSKRVPNIGQADKYLGLSNHPPIIDKETFEAVQKEKTKRSNIMEIDGVVKRREARYTAKK
jgi:site-specific DNA recombinase